MKKRILTSVFSILLVISILLPTMPLSVFAAEGDDIVVEDNIQTETDTEAQITDVTSAQELEDALFLGAEAIRITSDFEIDRTFFITHNVTIFTDEAHTLTRSADFASDVFVVGEASDGTLCNDTVTLTLGNPSSVAEDLLIINGNSENLNCAVTGSVIFLTSKAQADLYHNISIINNNKTGNERTLIESYGLSYPDTVGGAVAVLTKGSLMNIYGGNYKNNSVNTETTSVYGGAFYNFSTLNIYDATIENNSAVRAGAVYNYRVLNIYGGEICNNSASSMGGAIYAPASTGSFTYIGTGENTAIGAEVIFGNNTAGDGGAILCQATMDISNATFSRNASIDGGGALSISNKANVTIDNSLFTENTSGGSGGAVYSKASIIDIEDSLFEKNASETNGGALLLTAQSEECETVELFVKNTKFSENSAAKHGGGLSVSDQARVYLSKVDFVSNTTAATSSAANGGAIYVTNASIEYNGGDVSSNNAYNGGAIYLDEGATATINRVKGNKNTAVNNGGFAYSLGGTMNLYNSTLNSNTGLNGGGMYLYTGAVTNIYNNLFDANTATASNGSGGALFIYTTATDTLLHSNVFNNNSAVNYGGALQISGESYVDIYNITATGNSAAKGGFMYETKAGTVVDLAGVTVSGNTASGGGSIIWGNTLNAVLNIDKSNFIDADFSTELDDAYWTTAIANKLTVNDVVITIPEYVEYEQPEYDTDVSSEVRSAVQLERALKAGHTSILITRDFTVDRTYFITQDVNIYTKEAHTIKRAPGFTGDIFVVGEAEDGTPCENTVTLTLGDKLSEENDLLVIDGNSNNLTAEVKGSVIFLCAKGQADLYPNLTVINHLKTGNERTHLEIHGLSYPDTVGGAVAVITSGSTLNIYGGIYKDNTVNTSGDVSVYGAAFYNFSKMNIYDGVFESNSAVRAGAVYNYRTLNVYSAEFTGNLASSMGGAIYAPASTGSFTYIGKDTTVEDGIKVVFSGNNAADGGAVLCQATIDVKNTLFKDNFTTKSGGAFETVNKANATISNCQFINNTAGSSGGAISNESSIAEISNTVFEQNSSTNHGGAVYSTSASVETDTFDLIVKDTTFKLNSCGGNGGALYLASGTRAQIDETVFEENSGSDSTYGGAIYSTGSTLEAVNTEFISNSALSGGAITLNTSSKASFNNITVNNNTATKYGGFLYANTSEFSVYNSNISSNVASYAGAVYIKANCIAKLYSTEFVSNNADTSGGAVYASSAENDTVIHSCTFDSNTAESYGGAICATNDSTTYLYNNKAFNNTASRGGVLYIADYGTTVTVNGLEVKGNTADVTGDIIYSNSANAVININKGNYKDLDVTELDSAYWSNALDGRGSVNEISGDIPSYIEYGNESSGSITEYCDVSTSEELENAINNGEKFIRIVADFEIDRTFYISADTTIFSTKAHTLTRNPNFGSDIFVVGENAEHTSALLLGTDARLTLGNPESQTPNLLTIDGNKNNMNVTVTGTVIFICYSAQAILHDNLTVRNCIKTGNEKVFDTAYNLPGANRIGGTLAIIGSGTLTIHGGLYENNIIAEEDTSSEETRISTYGGLIFNKSNLRIYDGTFKNNTGARGGMLYNYMVTEIYGGTFEGNHATVSGGMVYSPSSAASHLIIGSDTSADTPILIKGNTAEDNGGAIYSPFMCALVIKNATIEGNRTLTSNGGAICVYGQFTARNVTFTANKAKFRGGAVYASNNADEYVTRYVNLTDCVFTDNEAVLGGAVSVYSSSMDYKNGGIVTISDCEFNSNKALKQKATATVAFGGAIYADRKSSVTVDNSYFNTNTAELSGGAAYITGLSTLNLKNCEFTENAATTETANGGAITVQSAYCNINASDLYDNTATLNGGGIYVTYLEELAVNSEVKLDNTLFSGNTGENGGAIYAEDMITNTDSTTITATDCEFELNKASRGGAVYLADNSDAYIKDGFFAKNSGSSAGGALYCSGSIAEIDATVFKNNTSGGPGGAVVVMNTAVAVMNNITAMTNTADSNGGFLYSTDATITIYNSNLKSNSASNGGAMYLYTSAVSQIYNCLFDSNKATSDTGNGGALFIYTSGTETLVHSNTFRNNSAGNFGGAMQISGTSLVDVYNTIANGNSAKYGGFMYITKAGTVVNLGAVILGDNTATSGSVIYGNTLNATLNIDKTQYTDTNANAQLDEAYWSGAIANKLTVNEASLPTPDYDDYIGRETPVVPDDVKKEPVSVQDVLSLGLKSSDESINSTYDKLPRLDNSSNFMSRSTSYYPEINGNTVSVDTFVYHDSNTAHNGNVGEGLLIYQAILYKQANPEEDVYIDISSYRFSVQAAVNINRNSRYFGYMRDLADKDYDQYGFVKIAYLLITAAKMGIHVNVIGQLDAYPVSSKAQRLIPYFTTKLSDPCDPDYVQGVIGDYLDFNFSYWNLSEKGGTDMMHTKLCAVSHYLDMNGVEHKNAVWTSSANLDGVRASGVNGNWKQQTASIVSDHEDIYRISHNYLKLIADYCGQEEIYEWQHLVNSRNEQQIKLILEGRGDEIPKDEQIVYIGSETDDVFELYFTPLGGGAVVWDEINNPYCKYMRELYNSEDYILFTYNAAEYSGGYTLGMQFESMLIEAFHKNRNPKNKVYMNTESFDSTTFDDLIVGKDIGFKSFNQYDFGEIHNKDLQFSYVKEGQRYFVTMLNSLNFHSGSMSYQSNQILVVKEKTCDENGVFSTIANLTTKGDIASHTYGDTLSVEPSEDKDGYTYHECILCGHNEHIGVVHNEGEWIIDKESTASSNGLRHKECLVCGAVIRSEEISRPATSVDYSNPTGKTFGPDEVNSIGNLNNAPLTIEGTIQLSKNTTGRGGVIVGNYDGEDAPRLNLEVYNGGRLRFYFNNGTTKKNYVFNTDIRSDKPVNFAITLEGSLATLYINGEMAETLMINSSYVGIATDNFVIGGDNRADNSQYFQGTIYSVNLFSDIRTPEEISRDSILVVQGEDNLLCSKYYLEGDTKTPYETFNPDGRTFSATDYYLVDAFKASPKTLEAVVKVPKNLSGRAGVIIGNYDGSNDPQLSFEVYTNGRVRLYYDNGTKIADCIFKTDIRSDRPVHIAVTTFANVAMLYVDGVHKETNYLTTYPVDVIADDFVIGGDNRKGNTQYFKGTIYSVNVFSDTRNEDEIKNDAILVAPNTDNILYSGIYSSDSPLRAIVGGAKFDESILMKADSAVLSTPKTIEATLNLPKSVDGRGGVIVGNYDGSDAHQLNLEIYSKGRVRLYLNNGINVDKYVFTTDIRSDGPVNVAVTISDTAATLYVNGVKAESKTLKNPPAADITEGYVIGGDNRIGNEQYFKGTIYSVKMFDDIRTQNEICTDIMTETPDTGLMHSSFFVTNTCAITSAYADHIESNVIIDYPMTNEHSGIAHTVCTKCGKRLSVSELVSTSEGPLYSVDFNGVAGMIPDKSGVYVDLAGTLTSRPLTLESVLMIGTDVSERAGVIAGNYDGSANDQINFEIYTNGNPRIYFKSGGKAYSYIFKTDIRSDKPVHMALVIDGRNAKLYVDGVHKETITMAAELPEAYSDFKIGTDNRASDKQYFIGNIYSVNIFDDVRTSEEVASDRILVTPNTPGVIYSEYYLK